MYSALFSNITTYDVMPYLPLLFYGVAVLMIGSVVRQLLTKRY